MIAGHSKCTGLDAEAEQRFQRSGVVVLASEGGELPGANRRGMEHAPDHVPEGAVDVFSRGAPGVLLADPLHFAPEDLMEVLAQGNDGGIRGAGRLLFLEVACRLPDQGAAEAQRLGIRRGSSEVDRFQCNEVHTRQLRHVRVEIMAGSEVYDGEGTGRIRTPPGKGGSIDAGPCAAAANDQVGSGNGCRQLLGGERAASPGRHEGLRAAGVGKDGNSGAFSVSEQLRHTPGVGAGTEENGRRAGDPGPAGSGGGKVQGNRGDGSAGAAERSLCPDVLRRAGGGLEQPAQSPASGSGGLCGGESAPDLAGDFALTHDDRIQAGGNGEEMFDSRGFPEFLEKGREADRWQPGAEMDRIEDVCVGGFKARKGRDFAIDFEPVAGGQDHGCCDG